MASIGVMDKRAAAKASAETERRRKHIPGFEVDCGTGLEVPHVGIVFVHGIGAQEPGETLLDWGGAMIGLLLDKRIAQKTDGDPVISCDLDPSPGKSRYIEVELPKASANDGTTLPRKHWILTEAWWAQRVRPPPFGQMADWLGPHGAISRIVLAILPQEKRRHNPRLRPTAKEYELRRDPVLGPEEAAEHGHVPGRILSPDHPIVDALRTVGRASAGLYLQAVSALILVIYGALRTIEKLLPIGPLKNGALTRPIDNFMLDWFGDVYVLLSDPAQAASVRGRLVDAIQDLHAANCETVVVVAHSGGAIVSYMMLADPAYKHLRVDTFITLGEGLNLAWRLTTGPDKKLDAETFNRYRRLYSSVFDDRPELSWHDFWASEDPAPAGVLDPYERTLDQAGLGRVHSHAIWNRLSFAEDHGGYWDNDEEFLLPMLRLIDGEPSGGSGRFETAAPTTDPSNRRRRRLSVLSIGRQLSLVGATASIVTAFALNGSGSIDGLANTVAHAWSAVPGAQITSDLLNGVRAQNLAASLPWMVLAQAGVSIIAAVIGLITLFALIAPAERPIPWARSGGSRIQSVLEIGPLIVGIPVAIAVVIAGVRYIIRSNPEGAQVGLWLVVATAEFVVLTLFVLVMFGSPFSTETTSRRSSKRDLIEMSLTIVALILVSFLAIAPFVSIILYPEVGQLVLGSLSGYAAFSVVGRIGTWRWNVWDGRERVALRAGKDSYPPLRRVVIQFSLLLAIVTCLFLAVVLESDALAMTAATGIGISVLLGVAVDVFNAAHQERTAPTVMGPRASAYKM